MKIKIRRHPQFPGYGIACTGQVWTQKVSGTNKRVGPWRKLDGGTTFEGYLTVNIVHITGKSRTMLTHRLVAEVWIGPIPEGFIVNHKDGDISNPKVGNLEIISKRDNLLHAIEVLGKIRNCRARGGKSGSAKLNPDKVRQIRLLKQQGLYQTAIGKLFGVQADTIRDVLSGRNWRHVV